MKIDRVQHASNKTKQAPNVYQLRWLLGNVITTCLDPHLDPQNERRFVKSIDAELTRFVPGPTRWSMVHAIIRLVGTLPRQCCAWCSGTYFLVTYSPLGPPQVVSERRLWWWMQPNELGIINH